MRIVSALAALLGVMFGCGGGGHGTPLIGAARSGDAAAIRALAAQGVDLNERGGVNGWTPLMHAIHKNQPAAVVALLEAGADPNARGSGGATALVMAAGYGYADIVEALLARGADPRLPAANGETPLSAAIAGTADIDRWTLGQCQAPVVKLLLAKAPDLDLQKNLHGAAAATLAKLGACGEAARSR